MKLLISTLLAISLVGCSTAPVREKEVVTVDRPVAFIPLPPTTPIFVSEVDKLVDADVNDPGKIAQAYKIDMIVLRTLVRIHEAILQQYRNSSTNFDEINKNIRNLVNQINETEGDSVDKVQIKPK